MNGHGHVTPNPDGSKARCGGPAICSACARELAALSSPPPPGPGTGWPDETPTPPVTDSPGRAAHAWIAVTLTNPFRYTRRHMHPETAALIDNTIRGHNAVAAGHPSPHNAGFIPERGDAVERWIKRYREQFPTGPEWDALDCLLDDYREHADTGTTLDTEISGPEGGQA